MVPLNLTQGGVIEFVNTGVWSTKALKEAEILGLETRVVASSQESNFDHIPSDIHFDDNADYTHITSNNTIYGTQYKSYPKSNAPLVVDASSDIFSYPIDWSRVALMYAGAQKNAGPSGVTIVIIKKSLLGRVAPTVPTMLRYKIHAENNSLYNTPPTFGIYLLKLTLDWIKASGGIKAIEAINTQKANLIYDTIDSSNGFFTGHAQKDSRSHMNVVFTIQGGNPELEKEFIKLTEDAGLIGLKGHRSTGGLRASIYNAVTLEAVEALVKLMKEFAVKHTPLD